MSRYFTRLQMRRVYAWVGKPTTVNRKLRTHCYGALHISMDDKPEASLIKIGQYILIEGEDDENPYVAKVLNFFGDEAGKNKKATVQWFARFCEVPPGKRKLLGREPHPQEIFLYQDSSCDTEISAETIIGTVQVEHLPEDAVFPETGNRNTLYVKMCWDRKAFKVMDSKQIEQHAVAPEPPAPLPRALPTPDLAVLKRAMQGPRSRVSMSTGKLDPSEAESAHSISKLSAAKDLSHVRLRRCSSTPGVRKKLELNSPVKKLTREEVIEELLHDEIETQKEQMKVSKLPCSTPRITLRINLSTPKCSSESLLGVRITPLKPCPSLPSFTEHPLQDQDSRDWLGVSPLEDEAETGVRARSSKTPKRATPKRSSLRVQKARTPSRRKDSSSTIKEPALGVLPEEDVGQTAMTPRSKRKSAQLVSERIRKQLKLLSSSRHLDLDSDDSDDAFVPAKKDMEISSEDEAEDEEVGSEEELVVKRRKRTAGTHTPRSTPKARTPARTPSKTPSKKAVPSTPRTPRHATPSIPSRSLPARNPGNVLEEARARLHVSSVPESLPCREQEFEDIYSFVESKIIDGTGGCMYISGVPGTGKTATVHEVIRCLQQASDQDEIPTFHFIEINGMKMTDPHQAYVQILQKLTDQKATADHAASLLEKRFSNPAPRKEATVLLVDELDLLWTRKQNVMYNLFDWPTRRHARLVVLAIANTMDLPERIMINRVASRLGLTRMSFQPYSFKQLQQIITSRLNRVKAFEEDALQLVSRKVAALSGDARRCLDICRRATEICEHSSSQPSDTGLVGMSHVMEALEEMFSSSYITAIRCASLQEQLFLRSIIAEFRRLGLEEATFQQVFVQHQALCRVEGLQPISVSEGLAVCQRLGACRLLLLEPSRLDLLLRVRLNVSQDDVLYALKED
ncbi:origin recognition complex subunit 1 isoform X1 [Conger conger]|uniref:origin recognition complex subunit 1 isoform X1 n=1 Tax=Conger conger TaxID=82655 RepID=UPI002A5AAFB5|nr:origin recognition complex subunit 1 isoform X1 [Conger conger]XP_061095830.1 origin recognition complex subunit 1 isoform X1 [Conger conger]